MNNKCVSGIIIAIIISVFVFHGTVEADEAVTTLPEEEYIEQLIEDSEVTDLSVTSELPVTITTTEYIPFNFILDSAVNDLHSVLDQAAIDNNYQLVYPEIFDVDSSAALSYLLNTDTSNPVLYRDAFITLILSYLDITQDNPLYDVFYQVLEVYYNDLTGITQATDTSAALTLAVCMLGSISLLGFIKWVF